MIFELLPLVEIGIIRSFLLANASICLEKIYLKPKSLPIAVIALVSVESEIAGKALLLYFSLTVNSVAKCCASAALPPFPKISIFPFFYSNQLLN